MRCVVDLILSHPTEFSAPSETLSILEFGLPYLSIGAGVIPQRYIFSTPAASEVRKIDPTLC